MSPTTNNRRQRWTEYHLYAEIVADITTQNSERKHTTQNSERKHTTQNSERKHTTHKTKKNNADPFLFKIDIKYTNITQALPKYIKWSISQRFFNRFCWMPIFVVFVCIINSRNVVHHERLILEKKSHVKVSSKPRIKIFTNISLSTKADTLY